MKKLIQGALEKLEAALQAGQSETLKAYLRAMGRFSRYSAGNALLIAFQRADATRVAGFQAWRKLGRWVRKGEKGIAILAPLVRRPGQGRDLSEKVAEEDGEAATGRAMHQHLFGFKAAYVFDIKQTDGRPLPEFATVQGNPGDSVACLKRLAEKEGVRVEYADYLGGAEGVSQGGVIRVRRGLSPAEEFSTLTHELGHEFLHRDGATRSRSVRETEAEAVAFVVCEAVGLKNSSASSDYIQLYDGNPETLMASLHRIRGCALTIIDSLGLGGDAPSTAEWQKPELETQSRSWV